MHKLVIAHPSEILYNMVLEAPKGLLQISNYELFKDIILNKKDLTEQNCEFFAKVFQTSKEYWMNMQAQWDEVNSILSADKPCPDVSTRINGSVMDAISHVVDTNRPAIIPMVAEDFVVLPQQAYNYMLSKCTEDEMWDLGFLGQSEQHVRKSHIQLPLTGI